MTSLVEEDARSAGAAAEVKAERAAARRRQAAVVAVHLGAIALWELTVRLADLPAFILPSPAAVLATLGGEGYDWLGNTAVTAAEIFGGYALSVVVGVALALAFSWSKPLTLLV